MRVLLLTQVLPYPPDSGPKVKTYNMVKFIAQNHELTLVSFVRGDQAQEIDHLKQYCEAVYPVPLQRSRIQDGFAMIKSLATSTPWLMARDDNPEMRETLTELSVREQFDIVHADQLNMAQFTTYVPGAARILDAHNALWLLYKRLAQTTRQSITRIVLEREWRLLKRYEGEICKSFEAVLTVSESDCAALKGASGGKGNLMVAPIAVDPEAIPLISRVPQADHILHIGTMFWPPNVDGVLWFLREVYPIILQQRPDACFDIVGARPPKEISDFGHSTSGVTVTGYVKDPGEYLKQTGVMVVPLLAGGGMRVKILEALAEGLPIVTTSIGCEGIAVENGKHLLVADTPQDFAQATLRLINDPAFAATLVRNGRELIESTYDFHKAYQPVNLVYEACFKN